jgi:hypothetical protein
MDRPCYRLIGFLFPPAEINPCGFYHVDFNAPQPPSSGTIVARFAGDEVGKSLHGPSTAQKTLTIR